MRRDALLALLATTFAIPSFGQDSVGFAADASCQSVIDAEVERGAILQKKPQPAEPALANFYGTQVFKRTHNGRDATVIYVCGGFKPSAGIVNMQLVYIYLESEAAAVAEYARQRKILEQQLGKPCWDPTQVQDERIGPRVVWNVRSGTETDLTWSKVVNKQPLHWTVLIGTHEHTGTGLADPALRATYVNGTCELPAKGASPPMPPNKSLGRTRGE